MSVRRIWDWFWRPRREVATPNGRCPACGRPVVTFGTTMVGNQLTGPMFSPQTQEELESACPVHGHSPYNDRSVAARFSFPPAE
jgi:hypothetical protein